MMTKQILTAGKVLAIASIALFSCKDKNILRQTMNQPIYKSKAEVRSSIKKSSPRAMVQTGKIFSKGDYILISEAHEGLHIIDNGDPRNPVNIAFLDIPGALDISSKGDYLYVDQYMDLVALDFSDPLNIREVGRTENAFMYNLPKHDDRYPRMQIDTEKGIVVDWEVVTTETEVESIEPGMMIWGEAPSSDFQNAWGNETSEGSFAATDFEGAKSSSSGVGKSGSMARFVTLGDYLYTIDGFQVKTFHIANEDPVLVSETSMWQDIETLFILRQNLFIGSRQGVSFYSLSNPEFPQYISQYDHIEACDPVIAEGDRAYLTIRSGNDCGQTINQLEVLDIANLEFPSFIVSQNFSNPHGLAKAGNLLFICDGAEGLKVLDIEDEFNITTLDHESGFFAMDAIAYPDKLMVLTENALYQYDYSNPNDLQLLSSISISQE